MIWFHKRYVCQGEVQEDLENKVVFASVLVQKEDGSLSWEDVVLKGIPVFVKGGKYDKLIKGTYKLKESDWNELVKYLYTEVDVIDCENEDELLRYEKSLQVYSMPEILKFLEERKI